MSKMQDKMQDKKDSSKQQQKEPLDLSEIWSISAFMASFDSVEKMDFSSLTTHQSIVQNGQSSKWQII